MAYAVIDVPPEPPPLHRVIVHNALIGAPLVGLVWLVVYMWQNPSPSGSIDMSFLPWLFVAMCAFMVLCMAWRWREWWLARQVWRRATAVPASTSESLDLSTRVSILLARVQAHGSCLRSLRYEELEQAAGESLDECRMFVDRRVIESGLYRVVDKGRGRFGLFHRATGRHIAVVVVCFVVAAVIWMPIAAWVSRVLGVTSSDLFVPAMIAALVPLMVLRRLGWVQVDESGAIVKPAIGRRYSVPVGESVVFVTEATNLVRLNNEDTASTVWWLVARGRKPIAFYGGNPSESSWML